MMNKLFFPLVLFLISACGFQVIYSNDPSEKISYEKELSSVRIQKSAGRMSQELRVALLDLLNPDNLDVDPQFILILNENKSVSGTFITFTGASGRNKVSLNVSYELIDAKNGETVATNSTIVNDNYDVQLNRYGTYVADSYAASNLSKIAALNIRNMLVNDFIEIKKAAEHEKEMATIKIVAQENSYSAEFAKLLQELLNKKYYDCAQFYSLELEVTQVNSPVSSSVSSNHMTLNASYILKEAKTGKIIAKDSNVISGDYIIDANNPAIEDEYRSKLFLTLLKTVQTSLVDEIVDFKKKGEMENDLKEAVKHCKIKEIKKKSEVKKTKKLADQNHAQAIDKARE